MSCDLLIPLSCLPLASGATRSAHAPVQPPAERRSGHGPGCPAPAPCRGGGPRSRRRLPLRDAGLRVCVRTRGHHGHGPRLRADSRRVPHPGPPVADAGAGGPVHHGRRRDRDRLPGPAAAARPRPGDRSAGPDAGRQAHRTRLRTAGHGDAAGVRLPGPAAVPGGAARLRDVLPAGERVRGSVGAAVRPDRRAGGAADRVHGRRAADPARPGGVPGAADGPLHRPRAERGLALRGHAGLRAGGARTQGAAQRPASGQPTGDATADRATAGRPAAGRAGAADPAGEASLAGGPAARAACAAIAAPTIPALF